MTLEKMDYSRSRRMLMSIPRFRNKTIFKPTFNFKL